MPESAVIEMTGVIAGAIGSAIAIAGAALKFMIRPIRKWLARIAVAIADIQQVKSEVTPNGGGSLKDIVSRIDARGERTAARTLALQDAQSACIYECDTDGCCTYANRALCDLFGIEQAAMMGNGWLTAIDHEHRAEVFEVWAHAASHGIPYENDYTVVNQRAHTRLKCRTYARPMRNSAGKVIGYSGIVERETP